MFLFFFLLGFVFRKKESIWIQVKTSAKALLLPYIFWNGIAIIFSLLIKEYTLLTGIKKLLFFDGVSWNSPIWFLAVLFWTRIFYQILVDKKWVQIMSMSLMTICSYYGILGGLPLGLDILPNAIIFFGIGKIVTEIEFKKWHYVWAVPLLAVSVVGSLINDRISVYGNYFGIYQLALLW